MVYREHLQGGLEQRLVLTDIRQRQIVYVRNVSKVGAIKISKTYAGPFRVEDKRQHRDSFGQCRYDRRRSTSYKPKKKKKKIIIYICNIFLFFFLS